MRFQYDWAGSSLVNFRILVCDRCYDTPQEQNRSIILPPDPTPVENPRPEQFVSDETDYLTLTTWTTDATTGIPIPNTTTMMTLGPGDFNTDFSDDFDIGVPQYNMTTQPVGPPTGYVQNAQMPLVAGQRFVTLPVVAMLSDGAGLVTVTTTSAHGLATNAQVAVQGVLSRDAAGAFSITVTNSTQFTYQTNPTVPYGSQLMAHTLVTTMNMGLPYGFTQIPQTGPV